MNDDDEAAIIQRAIWGGHPPSVEERDVIDMLVNDERLPDIPAVPTHIHSLDRCEHYIAGQEVGWLCGKFPMFTNIATANAVGDVIDDGDIVSVEYGDVTDAWEIVLHGRNGGRRVLALRRQQHEAMLMRDTIAELLQSWFPDAIAPVEQCQHLSATGVDRTEGPMKVWACDACGWRHYQREDEDGIVRMIPAPVR